MKFRLVDDAHNIWRRWSTRIAASQAGLILLWISLPQDMRDAVPRMWVATLVGLFAVSFIGAQVVKQPGLRDEGAEPTQKPEGDKCQSG